MHGDEFFRRVRVSPEERRKVIQELFSTEAQGLARRCRARGLSRSEADDAVHDVFRRLCEKWDSLSGQTPPSHWLNRLTTFAIADHYRKHRVAVAVAPAPEGHGAAETADGDEPEDLPPPPSGHQDEDEDSPSAGLDRDADPTAEADASTKDAKAFPASRAHPTIIRQTRFDEDSPNKLEGHGEDSANRVDALRCARMALTAFADDYPEESTLLSSYSLKELNVRDIQERLECPTEGAARQRLSQWRKRLSEYCRKFCETPDCS